jgi:pimeloyl-ACP methyl ester carboxylesterase
MRLPIGQTWDSCAVVCDNGCQYARMPWRPWAPRTVTVPAPDDVGTVAGLAYALYLPPEEPAAGVVVLHGADSTKESHLDFARLCRAHGLAAVAFDQRGHGATGGQLDGRMVDDVVTIADVLRSERPGLPVGLRGSSMGGWLALVSAEAAGATAVVAICPASGDGMLRALRQQRFEFPADAEQLETLIGSRDESAAAMALGERLLLMHAEGDEVVPVEHSRALHESAPGSRLIAIPGGHHRSVQHDPELQAEAVRFLARRLRAPD